MQRSVYNLNICIPPKLRCANPNVQCDGFRRCDLWEVLSHEGGTLMNGTGDPIKENPERPRAPYMCESSAGSR